MLISMGPLCSGRSRPQGRPQEVFSREPVSRPSDRAWATNCRLQLSAIELLAFGISGICLPNMCWTTVAVQWLLALVVGGRMQAD